MCLFFSTPIRRSMRIANVPAPNIQIEGPDKIARRFSLDKNSFNSVSEIGIKIYAKTIFVLQLLSTFCLACHKIWENKYYISSILYRMNFQLGLL